MIRLIISFANTQTKESLAIVCDHSIFNAINNYSLANDWEDYSETYSFDIPDDMSEMVADFFADDQQLQDIEIKYSKHNTGDYCLEFDANYHNTVNVNSNNFKLLISDWTDYLKKFTSNIQIIDLDYDNIEECLNKISIKSLKIKTL